MRINRTKALALVVAVLMVLVACDPLPPAPNHNGYQWVEVAVDNFDGNTLNTNFWSTCGDYNYGVCTGSYNSGRGWYTPSQVAVGFGFAALKSNPGVVPGCDPYQPHAPNPYPCTYKDGQITTARPFATDPISEYKFTLTRTAYAEARMWVSGVEGFNSAFWLMPANGNTATALAEIDVMEHRGFQANNVFMGYHDSAGGQPRDTQYAVDASVTTNGACPETADLTAGWHTYGVHWRASYLSFYIDNVKCGQITLGTYSAPMYLILDIQSDPEWDRSTGNGITTGTSAATLVDWVRLWKQAPL